MQGPHLVVRVGLMNGRAQVCELQINRERMIEAKELAHGPLEKVRAVLPEASGGG